MIFVTDVNPNEVTGGGGCVVCGSIRSPDQEGPFYVITNDNEMESNVSPHVVLCETCRSLLNLAAHQEQQNLAPIGGELEIEPFED